MIEQVKAYRCECEQCGHKWLVLELPARCGKCKARTWNKSQAGAIVPVVQAVGPVVPVQTSQVYEVDRSPAEVERDHRKAKKARRHAELKADCVGALPSVMPDKMKEALTSPPLLEHHPRCTCFRCRIARKELPASR